MRERPRIQLPVQLYRHYDESNVLLYIGVARDAGNRYRQHLKSSAWAENSVRMTIELFPDRASALAAEANAVVNEKPLHNINHLEKLASITKLPAPFCQALRGEPTIMISARIPASLVDFINSECVRTGATRSELLVQALNLLKKQFT